MTTNAYIKFIDDLEAQLMYIDVSYGIKSLAEPWLDKQINKLGAIAFSGIVHLYYECIENKPDLIINLLMLVSRSKKIPLVIKRILAIDAINQIYWAEIQDAGIRIFENMENKNDIKYLDINNISSKDSYLNEYLIGVKKDLQEYKK